MVSRRSVIGRTAGARRTAGRGVAWTPKPTYSNNFTVVEVPGTVTMSRSATYHQTVYTDPDTG